MQQRKGSTINREGVLNKDSKVAAMDQTGVNEKMRRVIEENRRSRKEEEDALFMADNERLKKEINMLKSNYAVIQRYWDAVRKTTRDAEARDIPGRPVIMKAEDLGARGSGQSEDSAPLDLSLRAIKEGQTEIGHGEEEEEEEMETGGVGEETVSQMEI